MEIFKVENLSFVYPEATRRALDSISFGVETGSFMVICGESGCGKSTLLRHFKKALMPSGSCSGDIWYKGEDIHDISMRVQSSEIGFVFQNPDTQIVTDKVWHELAFGLESLGISQDIIHLRVAEMASYFGIQNWLYKSVDELSGGQKQLLNLASIMAMHPKVLILDEPTSQLDPIAAADFLATIHKINKELGITVIMTEHRLEDVVGYADRVIVMKEGRILTSGSVPKVGQELLEKHSPMFEAMPAAMQIAGHVSVGAEALPYTVAMGRNWLEKRFADMALEKSQYDKGMAFDGAKSNHQKSVESKTVIQMKDVYFSYDKELPDVVQNLNFSIRAGEIFALMGGNGTGKTTTLHLLAGLLKPQRGHVYLHGKRLDKYANHELYHGMLGVLPQDPTSLFVKKTVEEDLYEMVEGHRTLHYGTEEFGATKQEAIHDIAELTGITELMKRHPYDLSGGEQQKAALAKVLLLQPKILLLDEPTKGLDAHFKAEMGRLLKGLSRQGITVVMVSHDIDFCAQFADRTGLFFEGNFATIQDTKSFFGGNHFYTTVANRMCRDYFPEVVTVEDAVKACKRAERSDESTEETMKSLENGKECVSEMATKNLADDEEFVLEKTDEIIDTVDSTDRDKEFTKDSSNKKNDLASGMPLQMFCLILTEFLLVPFCIWIGMTFFDDRQYLFIGLMIALLACVPFFAAFEKKKEGTRKLVVIAVLVAIAVAGRAAFFMVPSVKPMAAVVVVAGISLGAESGFLVGALTMLASNMLFGQGPWTPWQMFAMGLIGLFAGILGKLWKKGMARKAGMCAYGLLAPIILYGGIMNFASLLMMSYQINRSTLFAIYMSGLPLDVVHGASTLVFLFIAGKPILEKLDRVKIKYGID